MLSFRRTNMVVYTLVYASLSGSAIDLQKMPILERKIVFSDEAHFDLGGYVNKQSCHIYGTKNPHAFTENPMHPKRVTVWCGFWSKGIKRVIFIRKWARRVNSLKDNIREAIGEIQLHTIDNVLKNCTDCVGYCMASRDSHLNEIIFHY